MSELSGIPGEYIDVLRDMALDPATRAAVRETVLELDLAPLTDLVMPMPSSWRSDDYRLFCEDRRVRAAELARQIHHAVDELMDHSLRTGLSGVSDTDRDAVEEWTRDQFERELGAWLRVNPTVTYER